jgi:hypothetical protein
MKANEKDKKNSDAIDHIQDEKINTVVREILSWLELVDVELDEEEEDNEENKEIKKDKVRSCISFIKSFGVVVIIVQELLICSPFRSRFQNISPKWFHYHITYVIII